MAHDPLGSLGGIMSNIVHYLYYFSNLCITIGVFLLVVAVLKDQHDLTIISVRLIVFGFAVTAWNATNWKDFGRYVSILFFVVSVIPSHFYLGAYTYLK